MERASDIFFGKVKLVSLFHKEKSMNNSGLSWVSEWHTNIFYVFTTRSGRLTDPTTQPYARERQLSTEMEKGSSSMETLDGHIWEVWTRFKILFRISFFQVILRILTCILVFQQQLLDINLIAYLCLNANLNKSLSLWEFTSNKCLRKNVYLLKLLENNSVQWKDDIETKSWNLGLFIQYKTGKPKVFKPNLLDELKDISSQ